jgi:6-phosphogluconolactonase
MNHLMKTYFKTQVLPNSYDTANRMAMDFIRFTENMLRYRDNLYIALSGGSTPQLLFEIIIQEYAHALPWSKLHFFWVDERCVATEDPESNFGNANRILFSHVPIPSTNLHPVHGGDDPIKEVVRYTGEILAHVPCLHKLPVFDLILLGMGNDGHTASIFPGQLELFETTAICSLSQHPQTLQKRITLTGKLINSAAEVVFLITGNSKAEKVKSILKNETEALLYPAKMVKPSSGALAWYLDEEAASYVEIK